jgi:hypothetical protein
VSENCSFLVVSLKGDTSANIFNGVEVHTDLNLPRFFMKYYAICRRAGNFEVSTLVFSIVPRACIRTPNAQCGITVQ